MIIEALFLMCHVVLVFGHASFLYMKGDIDTVIYNSITIILLFSIGVFYVKRVMV